VNLFAPSRLYGEPDDFRRFVDRAHALNLAVILDVIYNHFGPDGNYLGHFSDDYLAKHATTEWGEAINFDGENSGPVRELFLANAGYWVDEFHLDGLRIDATQSIFDRSPEHILAAIGDRVRAASRGRRTLAIAESEPQDPRLVRPRELGGYGLDAVWSEDFHHAAMVAATGRRDAYYSDYRGTPQEFVSLARSGVLYQGQWNPRQGKRRGAPARDLDPGVFVDYLQNHDQVANAPHGLRFHRLTDPGRYRALTAVLLLSPGIPMLFQGQEFAASSPFLYFGDQKPEIAALMQRGRRDFLSQFPGLATASMQALVPRPDDPSTFARSKLDHAERSRPGHAEAYALHRELLELRREDPVFRDSRGSRPEGAVLGPGAFALRYFGPSGDDRLFVVNLGPQLELLPASEPLIAPPAGAIWDVLWSSEDPRYGGGGVVAMTPEENWSITGHSALVLSPVQLERGEESR
jgi:maltooligosyltrehalose trehalohydrolase